MILNTIQPEKNRRFINFATKTCQMLIEQTYREAEETLESKLIKPRETFSFKPPISIEGSCMIGSLNLEIYIFVFNLTEKKISELYTDTFDEFSFVDLQDELEEIISISDNTPKHLQHEKIGRRIIQAYEKFRSEKSSTDGYLILLVGYARSPIPNFEVI